MAWEDRSYSRSHSGASGNPLMWLLTGSVSIGTWFGIHVRLHASMLLFAAIVLIFPGIFGGPLNAVILNVVLFGVVLLHEFGHCFASRWVGGDPREIILTPIGGLAMADAPHRPWPTFFTVLGGPLVNVLICIITGAALMLMGVAVIPWNLLGMHSAWIPTNGMVITALWFIFATSWALLLFNLWPIFPLDGGQLLQSLLWWRIGYYKATLFACVTGMIGAVIMAMLGIATGALLLLFIAVSGFITCYALRRDLLAQGRWAFEDEMDFSASLAPDPVVKGKTLSRRAVKQARKLLAREHAEQEQIDSILAKVSASGMQSLTRAERKALHRATARKRSDELEMTHHRSV